MFSDLNIDSMKTDCIRKKQLFEIAESYNLRSNNDQPTSSSANDNIFCENQVAFSIIKTSLTDQYASKAEVFQNKSGEKKTE